MLGCQDAAREKPGALQSNHAGSLWYAQAIWRETVCLSTCPPVERSIDVSPTLCELRKASTCAESTPRCGAWQRLVCQRAAGEEMSRNRTTHSAQTRTLCW